MIEAEMDDLALLWREETPGEDEQLVQTLARRVGWRARLLRHADRGAAIVIAAGVALLVLTEGGQATAASGLLVVLAVGWATWKRHALWDVELSLAAPTSEAFLAEAARSTTARLKRTGIALLSLGPAVLLALLFGARLKHPDIDTLAEVWAFAVGDVARTGTFLAIIGFLFAHLIYSRKALRRELRQIEALASEYREEVSHEVVGAAATG
ncbi:MAG TPA: hypothetical protein VF727_01865 [Allosphingosinicella sp.]|jgi:hypothetical protein